MVIQAIYKNGVFTPKDPVDLPEGAEVNFEPRIVQPPKETSKAMSKVYEILSRSYDGGTPDLAERHNEHQP